MALAGPLCAVFTTRFVNILRQTSGVKPNAIIYKDPYLRGRFYTKYYLVLYIIVPIDWVSMAARNESLYVNCYIFLLHIMI